MGVSATSGVVGNLCLLLLAALPAVSGLQERHLRAWRAVIRQPVARCPRARVAGIATGRSRRGEYVDRVSLAVPASEGHELAEDARIISNTDPKGLVAVGSIAMSDALAEINQAGRSILNAWQRFKGTDRAKQASAHMDCARHAVNDMYDIFRVVANVSLGVDEADVARAAEQQQSAAPPKNVFSAMSEAAATAMRGSTLALNIVMKDVVFAPEVESHVKLAARDVAKAAKAFGRVGMLALSQMGAADDEDEEDGDAWAGRRARKEEAKGDQWTQESVSVDWVQTRRTWWGGKTVVDSSKRHPPRDGDR